MVVVDGMVGGVMAFSRFLRAVLMCLEVMPKKATVKMLEDDLQKPLPEEHRNGGEVEKGRLFDLFFVFLEG